MKPLIKTLALAVLLIGVFAYTSKADIAEIKTLELNNIDVLEAISEQELSGRPSSDYQFYVETDLLEKKRGASTINAKVFLLDKKSGKTAIVTNETIVVPNFKDTVLLEEDLNSQEKLSNGDRIINSDSAFSLKELIEFETINYSYIQSTNELLDLSRAI